MTVRCGIRGVSQWQQWVELIQLSIESDNRRNRLDGLWLAYRGDNIAAAVKLAAWGNWLN